MANICKFLSELKNIFHSNPNILIDIIKLSNTVNVTPNLLKELEDDYNTSPIDNNEDVDYIPDQLVMYILLYIYIYIIFTENLNLSLLNH